MGLMWFQCLCGKLHILYWQSDDAACTCGRPLNFRREGQWLHRYFWKGV